MFDYKKKIEELRTGGGEFGHLKSKIYLDHAANGIYMSSLIHDYYLKLTQNLFSNPHSHSESGLYTQSYVNLTREKILSLFRTNANEYDCVFVSNASSGFKLLGEVFDFAASGCFAYLNDNHTSVVGLREIAWLKGCEVYCVYEDGELRAELVSRRDEVGCAKENSGRSLFVYPAQSNFNSQKYPLEWIDEVQSSGIQGIPANDWFVCLDAASLVCTSVLDLSKVKPDFVPVSFYKIFGFPTGLGAVLIRKSDRVKNSIRKNYFGGGTVKMALINEPVFEFRDKSYHEFMEDGTIAYLDVIAVNLAINKFSSLFNGDCFMSCIESYVQQLSEMCLEKLNELKHFNGVKLVELYRKENGRQGPIFAFNLKDSGEKYISYILVNKLAQEYGMQLRVGCFCNIGACKMHLKNLNLLENYQLFGHKCGDHIDLINGLPTGAIRISLGYCSIEDDVMKFVDFLSEKFIDHRPLMTEQSAGRPVDLPDKQYFKLVKLFIYPVKSCAPLEVVDASWPLCSRTNSLLYDRHWIIVDGNQIPLTQKRLPLLTNLHVNIDVSQNLLTLLYKSSSMKISLELSQEESSNVLSICTHQINGVDCGDEVAAWLKQQFEVDYDCRLVKLSLDEKSSCSNENKSKSTFNNQADYLLISVNSVRKLRKYLLSSFNMNITDQRVLLNIDNQLISQFRANFVVEILGNDESVNEEHWKAIEFSDNLKFNVASLCTRCQMINISQLDNDDENKRVFGQLLKELYKFKANSKFGVYLSTHSAGEEESEMRIGMVGTAEMKKE